eukprot:scaffold31478_cov101-Isochrysis_galbana.AAC.6
MMREEGHGGARQRECDKTLSTGCEGEPPPAPRPSWPRLLAAHLDRIFTSMAGLNPSASSPASSSTSLHWTALSSLSASSAICDGNRASNKLACRAGRADASPSDSSSTGTAPLPSSVTCELPRASPCVGQLGPAKVRMQSTARSRERCESKTKGKSRSSSL